MYLYETTTMHSQMQIVYEIWSRILPEKESTRDWLSVYYMCVFVWGD